MAEMQEIAGKKLLILGANTETIPLVEKAKQLGVEVFVTDPSPEAPAKRYAHHSRNVDGIDVDGIVALVRKEGIDGIMVGVADRLIVSYQQSCERLGFPCYANNRNVGILTDKERFNEACLKHGIRTIPNYPVNGVDELESCDFDYPILFKPVDSNSGKGMSICYDSSSIEMAFHKAKRASKRGRVLVEKYMDCDDMFVYYTMRDGEVTVSATADRYTSNEQGALGKVCVGAVYPSKYSDLYFEQLHDKMLNLFQDLKIENGVLLISAFVYNNNLHLYDPGFRLQGEAPNIPIEAISGYDQKEMLIRFSLTSKMVQGEVNNLVDFRMNGKKAITLWILGRAGRIGRVCGVQELGERKNVIHIGQRLGPGCRIREKELGTESQVIARVYAEVSHEVSIVKWAEDVYNAIEITDEFGKDIIDKSLL